MTENIEKYYKNLYTEEKEKFNANGHKFEYLYNGRVKLVKEMISVIPVQENVVLDAGCGNGNFFDSAIRPNIKIKKCDAMDLLEDATRLVSNKYDEVYCGSTVQLSSFFKNKYSIVNSMEIFSYIKPEERQSFFKEHISILDKNGFFILTVTNLESIYRKIIKPEAELFPYYFNNKIIIDHMKVFKDVELVEYKGIDIFNIVHNVSSYNSFFLYELSFLFKKL